MDLSQEKPLAQFENNKRYVDNAQKREFKWPPLPMVPQVPAIHILAHEKCTTYQGSCDGTGR
jgi:hypothetical protein